MKIVFAEHPCPTIQSVEGLVNILIEGCEEAERRGAREPLSEVVVKLNHRTYRVTLTLLDEAAQAKKALEGR